MAKYAIELEDGSMLEVDEKIYFAFSKIASNLKEEITSLRSKVSEMEQDLHSVEYLRSKVNELSGDKKELQGDVAELVRQRNALEAELEKEKAHSKTVRQLSKVKGACIDELLKGSQQSQWISVEDRLPDHKQVVLVHDGEVYGYVRFDAVSNGWFSVGTNHFQKVKESEKWQPLPPPPTEEG